MTWQWNFLSWVVKTLRWFFLSFRGGNCQCNKKVPSKAGSTVGNIDNFWLITKSRFYANCWPKKVDFFLYFGTFLSFKTGEELFLRQKTCGFFYEPKSGHFSHCARMKIRFITILTVLQNLGRVWLRRRIWPISCVSFATIDYCWLERWCHHRHYQRQILCLILFLFHASLGQYWAWQSLTSSAKFSQPGLVQMWLNNHYFRLQNPPNWPGRCVPSTLTPRYVFTS